MNRRLIDPFQFSQLPEIIEEYLEPEGRYASSLCFNRRGTILATGTRDGCVILWDWETRGIAKTLHGHKGVVLGVSWSRDGRYLASTCTGKLLIFWDVLTGEPLMQHVLPGAGISCCMQPRKPHRILVSLGLGPPVIVDPRDGSQRVLPMLGDVDIDPKPQGKPQDNLAANTPTVTPAVTPSHGATPEPDNIPSNTAMQQVPEPEPEDTMTTAAPPPPAAAENTLPLPPAAAADAAAGPQKGGMGSSKGAPRAVTPPAANATELDASPHVGPSGVAYYNKEGDMIIVGYARGGVVAFLDARTLGFLDVVKMPCTSRVVNMTVNRRGNYLLVNCQDKTLRLYELHGRMSVDHLAQQLATTAAAAAAMKSNNDDSMNMCKSTAGIDGTDQAETKQHPSKTADNDTAMETQQEQVQPPNDNPTSHHDAEDTQMTDKCETKQGGTTQTVTSTALQEACADTNSMVIDAAPSHTHQTTVVKAEPTVESTAHQSGWPAHAEPSKTLNHRDSQHVKVVLNTSPQDTGIDVVMTVTSLEGEKAGPGGGDGGGDDLVDASLRESLDPTVGGQEASTAVYPDLETVRWKLQQVNVKSIKKGSMLHWDSERRESSPSLLLMQREFQNAVERCAFVSGCFTNDDEHVVAAAQKSKGIAHNLYVWDRWNGRIAKILEGPREAVLALIWHPLNSSMCTLAGNGLVLVWARNYAQSWTAFAPDFTELEENTEYVEQEDEFDWQTPGATGSLEVLVAKEKEIIARALGDVQTDEHAIVDVLTMDPDYVFMSDADDPEFQDQLHHLPVVIHPDEEALPIWEAEHTRTQETASILSIAVPSQGAPVSTATVVETATKEFQGISVNQGHGDGSQQLQQQTHLAGMSTQGQLNDACTSLISGPNNHVDMLQAALSPVQNPLDQKASTGANASSHADAAATASGPQGQHGSVMQQDGAPSGPVVRGAQQGIADMQVDVAAAVHGSTGPGTAGLPLTVATPVEGVDVMTLQTSGAEPLPDFFQQLEREAERFPVELLSKISGQEGQGPLTAPMDHMNG